MGTKFATLNRELQVQVSHTSKSASLIYTILNKQYHYDFF